MSSCNVTLQFLPERVINKIEFTETASAGLESVVGLIQVCRGTEARGTRRQ